MEPAQDMAAAALTQVRQDRCKGSFSSLLSKARDNSLPPRASLKCPSSSLESLAEAAPREPHYWSLLSYSPRGSPAGTRPLPTMPSTHAESCKPEGAIALPASAPNATLLIASSYLPIYPSDPLEGQKDGPFLPRGNPGFCAQEPFSSLLTGPAPSLGLKGLRYLHLGPRATGTCSSDPLNHQG